MAVLRLVAETGLEVLVSDPVLATQYVETYEVRQDDQDKVKATMGAHARVEFELSGSDQKLVIGAFSQLNGYGQNIIEKTIFEPPVVLQDGELRDYQIRGLAADLGARVLAVGVASEGATARYDGTRFLDGAQY
jgi:hypothetical protein